MGRGMGEGDCIGPKEAWLALRQMFWPAWGWGLLIEILAVVIVSTFAAYGSAPGLLWSALRLAWGTIAVIWFAINLFYWPFWLAQSDRRLMLTLRNTVLFVMKAPGFAMTLLAL